MSSGDRLSAPQRVVRLAPAVLRERDHAPLARQSRKVCGALESAESDGETRVHESSVWFSDISLVRAAPIFEHLFD